jgi:malonyl-CoA/methylmalonyl-CoA synthetase
MPDANLYRLLRDRFRARRDVTCLRLPSGPLYSYGAMDDWSARMAAALARLGARPGDRVVMQVEKCPAAVVLYLACLRGGFVLVPLNTAYTAGELAYFISDAKPAVVVCDGGREAEMAPLLSPGGSLVALAGSGGLEERAAAEEPAGDICGVGEGELAAILYTSGTTGRSKGAMLSHGNLASNALVLHHTWGFREGDTLLHALPIFHVHGLFIALNTAMLNASEIIFLDRFDVAAVLEALPSATVMMGVPTFYTRLLASPAFGPAHFGHMRLFISGSAPLTEQTFERFESRTGQRILERYGMTETGMISSNPLRGERVAGSVGFALPGTELRVCDERGEPAACGEVGTVEVRGPNVFRGYWNAPEKSAAEFRPGGWFITGDLGYLDREGRLRLVGRARDLIISGGLNVYPKEVELCLDATADIAESAVIGVPHPDLGEAVVAVCVAGCSPAPPGSQVLQAIEGQLAPFKRPKAVLFVDALPRNAMGKVQKNALRERYGQLFN